MLENSGASLMWKSERDFCFQVFDLFSADLDAKSARQKPCLEGDGLVPPLNVERTTGKNRSCRHAYARETTLSISDAEKLPSIARSYARNGRNQVPPHLNRSLKPVSPACLDDVAVHSRPSTAARAWR
jgi:hypothetical protein